MKKVLLNRVFIILITAIICISGTITAVTLYQSNQIAYNPSDSSFNATNVKDALDELYDMQANAAGVPSNIAKDVNGNNAEAHYYGARISSTTRSFTMPKGKYTLFVYNTYNRWLDGTNVGGDTTNQTSVTLSNGTVTKINDYAYIIDVTGDTSTVNISLISYGVDENQRTIYEICFYN